MSQELADLDRETLRRLFESADQARTTSVKYVARAAGVAGVSASVLQGAAAEAGVTLRFDRDGGRPAVAEDDDELGLQCAEEGCENLARYLEPADGEYLSASDGYLLTCGEHGGEHGVYLDEFDFGDVDAARLPPSMQRLSLVANIRESWANEHEPWETWEERERPTASLMVRDRHGELIGESERYDFPAIWALVAVDLPDDLGDYVRSGPTIPEWVEWEHCDPPMDHHVEGVRCSVCEQAYHHIQFPRMPKHFTHVRPWESIQHRRGCPHASSKDEERWDDRQVAFEIQNRPHPSVMALPALWSEIERWEELRDEEHDVVVYEAIDERVRTFSTVLERRLDPNYPACVECGKVPARTGEYELECHCQRMPEETREAWWGQHRRVWGRRGHGEKGVES